ncbi:MAG: hypothetical protein EOP54_13345, partial [Sphingobacteriales bacterium]
SVSTLRIRSISVFKDCLLVISPSTEPALSLARTSKRLPSSESEKGGSVDGEITNKQSLKTEIDRILNVLTDKQRKVIRMYFGLGYEHAISLEDIGASFDLTRERVRQIKDKAISRLQSNNQCHLLKYFLG